MDTNLAPLFGGVAAIAAIAATKKKEKEEELKTSYGASDLDGWEFKIVRSHTGSFKSQDRVRKVCEEEAQAGWELVEKFDNSRLRFKRKTAERDQDGQRTIDPYRTVYGMSEGMLVTVILGGIALLILLVVAIKN